jgi:hypothetical protein
MRSRAIRCTALLACWLAASTAAYADAGEAWPDLTWIDRTALDAGDVLFHTERPDRPLSVLAKVAVKVVAPPEAVWSVLTACEISPEYVPNIVSCRSLEKLDGGRAELFVQVVKAVFFLPTFEHVFRLDYEPYRRIGVTRVSGPIERLDGIWWLVPEDDRHTLLVYEQALDPGMPVPRFMVRGTLRRDLPKVLEAVRERAQSER